MIPYTFYYRDRLHQSCIEDKDLEKTEVEKDAIDDISRIWKDPKKEKPTQGKEVILLLKNGERHAGHWLLNANKYVTNSYVDEDEVVAWMEM